MAHVLLTDQVFQTVTAALQCWYDQRCTRPKRRHDLRYRRVKARRGKLKHASLRRDRKPIDLRYCKRGEPAMCHRHAFWRSGGTGGVDDVSEVLRLHARCRGEA